MRKFQPSDLSAVRTWMRARGAPMVPEIFLPKIGLIVDHVACGFLIQTDAHIAILDHYMSNPHTPGHLRNAALDDITYALITEAQRLGYRAVKCDTYLGAVKRRAREFKFTDLGEFHSFMKEL